MTQHAFTPALGRIGPIRCYDAVIAMTRQRLWRGLVLAHAAPRPGEVIVDVGCGTGSLLLMLHRAQPTASATGVDPDPRALAEARRKAESAGAAITWQVALGDALTSVVAPGSADTVLSTLVLHQCPMAMKRAILGSMLHVLRPGGRLVIADFGRQRTRLMRLAFRTVQLADGYADTQPNADGVLPGLITEAGFSNARETDSVPTVNGSISIYVARRPHRS